MESIRARPGRKPPFKSLMIEVHFPRAKSGDGEWSTSSFVHLLDEFKRNVGKPVAANGLEEIPVVIKKLLRTRLDLTTAGGTIRKKRGSGAGR